MKVHSRSILSNGRHYKGIDKSLNRVGWKLEVFTLNKSHIHYDGVHHKRSISRLWTISANEGQSWRGVAQTWFNKQFRSAVVMNLAKSNLRWIFHVNNTLKRQTIKICLFHDYDYKRLSKLIYVRTCNWQGVSAIPSPTTQSVISREF